ncbi:hypothetical protein T10_5354 [Trichinella papuae]|uniref:Uncharacterized protein n=1 Tax=Trichinella papuae TaxID=268474 RepID=A0A0V1M058_9BILA|nr:hypothetical protein T10_5354 [Trichinella papuae]
MFLLLKCKHPCSVFPNPIFPPKMTGIDLEKSQNYNEPVRNGNNGLRYEMCRHDNTP